MADCFLVIPERNLVWIWGISRESQMDPMWDDVVRDSGPKMAKTPLRNNWQTGRTDMADISSWTKEVVGIAGNLFQKRRRNCWLADAPPPIPIDSEVEWVHFGWHVRSSTAKPLSFVRPLRSRQTIRLQIGHIFSVSRKETSTLDGDGLTDLNSRPIVLAIGTCDEITNNKHRQ